MGAAQVERQQQIERDLSSRVVALLEPVVGDGRVRVNVSARLNPESEERTDETWDPNSTVIRSRQLTADAGTLAAASGQAGARANQPPPAGADGKPATAPPAAPAVASLAPGARGSEVTNFEISRSTSHRVRPSGALTRLSVAVMLDNDTAVVNGPNGAVQRESKPRSPEEIQKIHGLVAAAVGLDTARGDQLTVENIPFDEAPIVPDVAPGFWTRVRPHVETFVAPAVVLTLALLAFIFVIRPLVARVADVRQTVSAALPAAVPRTIQDIEGDIEAQLDAAAAASAGDHRKMPVLTRRLSALAQKEPEHAARLLRMWMSEEGR
jgi:flagellar M-ring protein FliF